MYQATSHSQKMFRGLCLGLLVSFVGSAVAETATTTQPTSQPTTAPTKETPKTIGSPIVTLEIMQGKEPLGNIVLELDADKAPITTHNFIRYSEEDFYNDTIFHRVMPGFMIQGGGHLEDLSQKTKGQHPPILNEWKNGLKNKKGTIAMARTSAPDSATSQFFINVVDNGMLDMPRGGAAYAVFGKVIEGMDVVEKIRYTKCIAHPKYRGQGAVTPEVTIKIKSAKVTGKFDRAALDKRVAAIMKPIEEKRAKAEAMRKKKLAVQTEVADKELAPYVAKLEDELAMKAQKTESGIYSFILKEGAGESPKVTDTVKVHYSGWLLDGKKFDSSYDRGEPITFSLQGVIPGWTEGVSLMKVGEKRKLVIPWPLAYGERGSRGAIPGKASLVFDVELLEINPTE